MPGGERVRQQIDQCECSVFRRIPSRNEVVQAATESRARVRNLLLSALVQGKVRHGAAGSTWAIAQVAAAIYADPDAKATELEPVAQLLATAFTDDALVIDNAGMTAGRTRTTCRALNLPCGF